MPYVTSIERLAREEGRQEGRQEGIYETLALALEVKFGAEGVAFSEGIRSVKDIEILFPFLKDVLGGKSLDELRSSLTNQSN